MMRRGGSFARKTLIFLSTWWVALAFAGISVAAASLTFSGTNLLGDNVVIIDTSSTISIGTASSTGITIGRSGVTTTFPGTVNNPNVTSSIWYGTSTGNVTPLTIGQNLSVSSSGVLNAARGVTVPLNVGSDTISGNSIQNTSTILSSLNIAMWGDSLTAGGEDLVPGGGTVATYLSGDLNGVFTYNFGIIGQITPQITSRFLAASSTWKWFNVIWAGTNDLPTTSSIITGVASMTAMMPNGNFIILGPLTDITQYPEDTCSSARPVAASSTASVLAAAYPNNFIDIYHYLVNQYNPSIPADVIDFNNCQIPQSLRAVGETGTLGPIGPSATSFAVTSTAPYLPNVVLNSLSVGYILNVGAEKMFVTGVSGSAPNQTVTVVRGYGSTVAGTYSANTTFTAIDHVHLSSYGYSLVAQQVANKYLAMHSTSTLIGTNDIPALFSSLQTYYGLSGNNGTQNYFFGNNTPNQTGLSNAAPTTVGNYSQVGYSTGIGGSALESLSTGQWDTALGAFALASNTIGSANTAEGTYALMANTTGADNVANGTFALESNTTGLANTAVGAGAQQNEVSAQSNTAVGTYAGQDNVSGSSNTAVGATALGRNTNSYNTAIGAFAGDVAAGLVNNVNSTYSIYIGYFSEALASGDSNEIVIGNNQAGLGSNTTYIGNPSTVLSAVPGTLRIATSTAATKSCLEMVDAGTGLMDYLYASSSVLTVTSSKPAFCQ